MLLSDLRIRILQQQQQVDYLISMLSGKYQMLPDTHEEAKSVISPPRNFAQMRERYVEASGQYISTYRSEGLELLRNEKEPASAIFLKLSQLLLKWSELELALLKEMNRLNVGGVTDEQEAPLEQEDIAILKEYIDALHL